MGRGDAVDREDSVNKGDGVDRDGVGRDSVLAGGIMRL